MNLIAAVDNNWAIGYKGNLLERIPEDLKNFKKLTTGKVVVLGRKTLETFPNKKPLPNRTNIILSRNPEYKVEGAIVVHSKEELFEELNKYNDNDIFIIGGESIYRMMLPYCTMAYVTRIYNTYDADTYFPNLKQDTDWILWEYGEMKHYQYTEYNFCKYERISISDITITRGGF